LTSVIAYRERRLRSATVDSLRYPVKPRTVDLGTGPDQTVKVPTVLDVLYCRRADANGAIVAGELVSGTDFVVTAEGDIDWTLGDGLATAPAVGEAYALAYYTNPVYVVRSMPFAHRDTRVKTKAPEAEAALPVLVDCSLEWLGAPGG